MTLPAQIDPPPAFAGRIRLARFALLWERVWPALFPALAIIGTFLVVALADLLPALPGWAHAGLLAMAAAALGYAVWRAFRGFLVPDESAGRRRLEQASGFAHRPLTTLADRLPEGADPASAALWHIHRERMAAMAKRLRIGTPAAGWGRRDGWGLRAGIALLLVIAVVDAGDQWDFRLLRALRPSFASVVPVAPATLDLWLTPPDYTGLAPQFLQRDRQGETIAVPENSMLLAQVSGGREPPKLKVEGGEPADFARVDARIFKLSAAVTGGTRLVVEQDGATLGAWPIQVIRDEPPQIAFAAPPQRTQRSALRLEYLASDDYGVETVKAVIRRAGAPGNEALEVELPLPGQRLKEARGASFHDFTPHPWAGLPVEIRLQATDAIGQIGESEPFPMALPERVFNHPIARAIIEQRKQLTLDPTQRDAVAEILSDLSARPGRYHDDVVVFMALRTAHARLRLDKDGGSVPAVQQLLWDTALRVEDGRMSLADRELRQLQQALQEALARNAPDAEIERLMNELQQAMDRFLRAMAENMERMDPSQMERVPMDQQRMVTPQDLQKMLDRARELAKSGAKDAARDMLARLQQMLENLRAARPGQQQGDSQSRQAMRAMRDMMQKQQQLLDKSFRAARKGEQGQQQRGQRGQQSQRGQRGQQGQQGQQGEPGDGQGEMGDAAQQQEALRRMLGEMMRQLGEGSGDIPAPFGRAERAMRDAAEALQRGQPGQAVGPQTEALDQLQQAMRSMQEQQQQQMGDGEGMPDGSPDMNPSRQRVDRDPLGRPLSGTGSYDQGDVKIPDQADVQRAREILDELRRRAGERSRPELERDYIDRLLKRF